MNLFQQVQLRKPGRNKFNLSHERKMSIQMGNLYPIMVQEIVPGDIFRCQTEIMARMAPMLAPIMHRVNVRTEYFFVPNRLVWSEWEEFITGGREGTSAPVAPYMLASTMAVKTTWPRNLADYMGIPRINNPVTPSLDIRISMLPFRAYQLIYDQYYRDQNLQASITEAITFRASGEVIGTPADILLAMRKRAWEKDYFTSALPWSQRGGEVNVPLAGSADVVYKDISEIYDSTGGTAFATGNVTVNNAVNPNEMNIPASVGTKSARVENIESVDLESATGVSINELRRSVRLQEWLEKNARGGARYVEQILAHFGVKSSDARLQRPEYLGGGLNQMVISEVLSTFQDPDAIGEPQGNMAGHGVSYGKTNGFKRSFEEHGYVIGILSVLPKTAYQDGIPRHYSREDKLDYYWPEFAQIGEQEILNKEVFYNGAVVGEVPAGTFGYTPRYAEYKYAPSTVHGEFRDDLSYWHMGRIFDDVPALNEAFVVSDPTTRIFPVTDPVDTMYVQLYHKVDAIRPMPYFGTPTL